MRNPQTIKEFKASGHYGIADVIINTLKTKSKYISETDILSSLFMWSSTTQGHEFWRKINKGDYSEFYERYPEYTNPEESPWKTTIVSKPFKIVDNYGKPTISNPLDNLPEVKKLVTRKKIK